MTNEEFAAELALGKEMSAEEAERMLVRLRGHFNQTVMPVERYCNALRTWQKVIQEKVEDLTTELFPGIRGPKDSLETRAAQEEYKAEVEGKALFRREGVEEIWHFQGVSQDLAKVSFLVAKSSFLARAIYGGEKFRTRKCPLHRGSWSGVPFSAADCEHNCDLTGWIRED
jgi:hypothetical protein